MKVKEIAKEFCDGRGIIDYAVELDGGRTSRVQIDYMQPPYWYDGNFDADERGEVLDFIDASKEG